MRRRPLSWQIASTNFCIAVLIAGVLGTYVAHRQGNSYEELAWTKLETAADACVMRLTGAWAGDGPPQLAVCCRELAERFKVRVSVILPAGKVIADSEEDPATLDNHAERPEVVLALSGGTGRSSRLSTSRQESYMYLAMPLRHEGQIVAVVRTAQPQTALTAELRTLDVQIVAVGLAAVLAITAGSFLATRRFARALDEIRCGADRLARGQWNYRLPDDSVEELGMLTESLNVMASQLDERIQRILRQQSEHQAMLSSM